MKKSKGKGQRSKAGVLAFALCLSAFDFAACARLPAIAVTPDFPHDSLERLATEINAALNTPGVQRGLWGIAVHSLDRDETLFELNPGRMFVPASTAKLVALGAAVHAVGWDYRYETVVRATGPIADGILQGDLVVTGSGDPSIGGRAGRDLSAFVDVLKTAGIRRIEGRIVGDDDALEEPRPQLAWAWDDLGYPTGALFGALNLGENRMEVIVGPGPGAGEPATLLQPYAWGRPMRNRATTGPAGSTQLLWPEQRPGEPLSVAGSIPAGAPPARLSVSVGNPTLWFANALRGALIAGGIEVRGEAYDIDELALEPARGGGVVYTHVSPPLAELAQPMLKDSINLYGEAALRLSTRSGAFPTNDAALEGLRATLTEWGVMTDAWQVIDGSGLSRRNTVAPEMLIAVLRRMYDPSGRSPWMTALPVAAQDGTLAARMTGTAAAGNVRAKTGTMSNIRALAGYVRTRDGETLAFAVIVNNFEGTGAMAIQAIDRIAVALANFTRVSAP